MPSSSDDQLGVHLDAPSAALVFLVQRLQQRAGRVAHLAQLLDLLRSSLLVFFTRWDGELVARDRRLGFDALGDQPLVLCRLPDRFRVDLEFLGDALQRVASAKADRRLRFGA